MFVRSEPPQAEVLLDGEWIGQSPLAVDVCPGRHRLGLELEQYHFWYEIIEVIATETFTVDVQLQFLPAASVIGKSLEPADEVKALRWLSNGQLLYLVGSQAAPPSGDLPYEWVWWSYDLSTQSKQAYTTSVAPMSEAVLEDLGIVPEEGGYSVSPDGEQIIYTHFDGCQKSEGRFCEDCYTFFQCPIWRANADGTNRVPLGTLPAEVAEVYWSPGNDWAIIYYWFPEGPIMFYVAKTDGTFLGDLEEFAGVKDEAHCAYPPRSPVFSPNGQWMAVQADSQTADSCGVWVVSLDERYGIELDTETGYTGGFVQWSLDSSYTYLLQEKILYKFSAQDDFASPTILARDIPYRVTPDLIAVSPDETMIAMGNLGVEGDLIILQFAER